MPNPNPTSSVHAKESKPRSSTASNRSNCSSSSTSWIKAIFGSGRRCQNPDLTEESLEKFNRENAANDARKSVRDSPYYRGLTSSVPYTASRVSMGRESRRTATTSTSSISTVLTMLQEWGSSCFPSNRDSKPAAKRSGRPPPHPVIPVNSRASVSPSVILQNETGLRRDEIGSVGRRSRIEDLSAEQSTPAERKPLRERVLIPMSSVGISIGLQEMRKEPTTIMKEKEFVWADKYRPKVLNDFICNRDKADLLCNMVARQECNHFIFEGPPGVGKKTMVWAYLREAFGNETLETREELREFKLKGEMVPSIKVNMKKSPRHVEMNLSELRGYEKHVIMTLIEETHGTAQKCDLANCQAIVLYRADKLSADSQHYIRWIMERHKGCNKILFCCSDISKLRPVRSICTPIQLLPPSNNEIVKVLKYIAEQEGIELPHHLAERITEKSKQNLRQAIRSFEASWQLNYPFKEDQVILTGWEEDIANIAKNIIDEQSPKQLYMIRGKLQNLIEHNVSPEFIFSTLVCELKKLSDDQFQPKIDALYLEYNRDSGFPLEGEKSLVLLCSQREELDKRIIEPERKNVYHFMKIEEFTAKFMSHYKIYVKTNFRAENGFEI
ncbi:replication factor C subunit 3-like [Magnolia sinica]|uniref:replication factor C subunit 3-like n=1 Tax=Magnolia sinica TaxID=86752 RepID=UPI00265A2692|nr:replication factor C subunit 3-like [Magnolia sinica]